MFFFLWCAQIKWRPHYVLELKYIMYGLLCQTDKMSEKSKNIMKVGTSGIFFIVADSNFNLL